jgi:hypothetical protein
MAVTGDIETADESEQDTTDSDSIRFCCTFCGHNYRRYPSEGCEHLLCKVESLESNFELVEAPDHPVTATLFGMEVPRVVATRFMSYLRRQARTVGGEEASYVHTNDSGVCTVDLLAEKRSRSGIVVIKSSIKTSSSFCERTFYLSSQPMDAVGLFSAFVNKHYCEADGSIGDGGEDMMDLECPSVPFSRVQLCSDIMALDVEDLVPEIYEAGNWVMAEGLPDGLPLFFFAAKTPTHDPSVMLINHSATLTSRMKCWPVVPGEVSLHVLSRLPSVIIN